MVDMSKLNVRRFIRKPFPIDEVQVTAENFEAVAEWCGGTVTTEGETNKFIKVRVHRPLNDRQTKAFVGDHVLYAGSGYKVYTHKAFLNSFEPAPDSTPSEPIVTTTADRPKPKKAPKTRTAVLRTPVHGDVTVIKPDTTDVQA